MCATRNLDSRLETRANAPRTDDVSFRSAITVRSAALTARLREAQEREEFARQVEAFIGLFADAPALPAFMHEWTRADRRVTRLYDWKLQEVIDAGIAAGLISRRAVIAFRAAQVRHDLARFPDAKQSDDALWCALFKEAGEMMEAQAEWKANPNPTTTLGAVKETDDLIGVASLVVESQRASA